MGPGGFDRLSHLAFARALDLRVREVPELVEGTGRTWVPVASTGSATLRSRVRWTFAFGRSLSLSKGPGVRWPGGFDRLSHLAFARALDLRVREVPELVEGTGRALAPVASTGSATLRSRVRWTFAFGRSLSLSKGPGVHGSRWLRQAQPPCVRACVGPSRSCACPGVRWPGGFDGLSHLAFARAPATVASTGSATLRSGVRRPRWLRRAQPPCVRACAGPGGFDRLSHLAFARAQSRWLRQAQPPCVRARVGPGAFDGLSDLACEGARPSRSQAGKSTGRSGSDDGVLSAGYGTGHWGSGTAHPAARRARRDSSRAE